VTEPALTQTMLARALDAEVPARWVPVCEVCGARAGCCNRAVACASRIASAVGLVSLGIAQP
jgi:hypothetical protein